MNAVETGFTTSNDGTKITYRVMENKGLTVVLGHGVCANSGQMERTIAPGLHVAGFRVVLYDQRGAGLSGKPSKPESYILGNYVADVLAVCKVVSTTETERVFVGYSLAGRLALEFAKASPGTFNKYVILSYGSEMTDEVTGFIQALHSAAGNEGHFPGHLKNIGSGRLLDGLSTQAIKEYREGISAYTEGALQWPLVEKKDLEQMTRPTMRIVGLEDEMMIRSAILDSNANPNSVIAFLSGGHPAPLLQKEETVAYIARFLHSYR